jgi:hypothetical protein
MSDAIVSRIERHQLREQRRVGLFGLLVIVGCLAATCLVLLLGSTAVHGASVHHAPTAPAARVFGLFVGAR